MIIRNVAGQNIPIPGTMYNLADNAVIAATTGVSVSISKDGGASAAGEGTLSYAAGFWYAPTQGETDANAIRILLTKSVASEVSVGVITQNPTAIAALKTALGTVPASIADKTGFTEPQAIRDAMKLAPSVGAPAAGSIDAMVDGNEIEPEDDIATGTAQAALAADVAMVKVKTDALLLTDGKVTTANPASAPKNVSVTVRNTRVSQ